MKSVAKLSLLLALTWAAACGMPTEVSPPPNEPTPMGPTACELAQDLDPEANSRGEIDLLEDCDTTNYRQGRYFVAQEPGLVYELEIVPSDDAYLAMVIASPTRVLAEGRENRLRWIGRSTEPVSINLLTYNAERVPATVAPFVMKLRSFTPEPDDVSNQIAGASPLAVGAPLSRSFEAPGDLDVFSFTAEANKTYVVRVTGAALKNMDVVIEDGTIARFGAFELETTTSRALFGGPEALTYFIRIGADFVDPSAASYLVEVNEHVDSISDQPEEGRALMANETAFGAIETAEDVDYFRVEAQAFVSINLMVYAESGVMVSTPDINGNFNLGGGTEYGSDLLFLSGTLTSLVDGPVFLRVSARTASLYSITLLSQ